jgi:hypothetical protein
LNGSREAGVRSHIVGTPVYSAAVTHFLHSLETIWSPAVIAAAVASVITYLGNGLREKRQRKRDGQAAVNRDRASAYGDLLARSLAAGTRIQAIRATLPMRSGIKEGVNVTLGLSKPLDMLALHDWLDRDFGPMHEAWSRVWAVGSQEALDAADNLVNSCAELMRLATTFDPKRLRTVLRGVSWTAEEEAEYDRSVVKFSEERVSFARLMRDELGMDSVEFTLERLRRERSAVAVIGQSASKSEVVVPTALS